MAQDGIRPLLDLMRNRRSIRRYQDRLVPHETLELLLEAARWAPSAHNRQPWRLAVIESAAIKQRLAAAMGERLRADLERDGAPPSAIENDVSRSYARIVGAPLVLVVCLTMRDMDSYADARRQEAERTMAIQSVAMAVQNLLLAAQACGLGACWMCAPLFVPDTVRRAVNLELDWEPQALITVGFPDETRTKTRQPAAEWTQYLDREGRG